MGVLFKKENIKKTILTFCYLILGVLFCSLLTKMFNFAEFVLCYLLLLVGIICIVVYALLPSDDKDFKILVFGIVATALGFMMMVWARFFGVMLSAIICYSGVSLIVSSVKQKQKGERAWITEFVVGILVTTLSVVTAVLSGTNTAKNILSIFVGVMLLINGGFGVSELILIVKNEKQASVNGGDVELKENAGEELLDEKTGNEADGITEGKTENLNQEQLKRSADNVVKSDE